MPKNDKVDDGNEEFVARVIAEMDSASYGRHVKDINAGYAATGATIGHASQNPDIPSCDACGKEFSGNMLCTRCESAFYCDRECQVRAWKKKQGGHKQECAQMKEQSERIAKEVVTRLKDTSIPLSRRMSDSLMCRLDMAGPYQAAVKEGLNEGLLEVLRTDQDVLQRYQQQQQGDGRGGPAAAFSFARDIMNSLFRGQRVEGRGDGEATQFNCIDGGRVKSFVKSSPEAFDVWMDASIQAYRLPLDTKIFRNNAMHREAHRTARDTWVAWTFVFANKHASRAIILPSSTNNREPDQAAAVARVKGLAQKLKTLLTYRWRMGDERDYNSALEGILNQVIAMIAYWTREFKVDVDIDKLMALKGSRKQMYETMAVPLGEGMIKKGKTLTNPEGQAAMQEYAARRRGRR